MPFTEGMPVRFALFRRALRQILEYLMSKSFKPEVLVQGTWSQNAVAFATKEEAEASARDLFGRWTLTSDHRAVESDQEPNYHIDLTTMVISPIAVGEPA